MGPGEDGLFGDGWSSAEPDGGRYARSVIAKRAFIAMPAASGPLNIEIAPAGGKQSMTIYINDKYVQTLALRVGRNRYTVPAEWRAGINILRFEFDRAEPNAARVYAVGIGRFDGPDAQHPVHLALTP